METNPPLPWCPWVLCLAQDWLCSVPCTPGDIPRSSGLRLCCQGRADPAQGPQQHRELGQPCSCPRTKLGLCLGPQFCHQSSWRRCRAGEAQERSPAVCWALAARGVKPQGCWGCPWTSGFQQRVFFLPFRSPG